MLDAMSDGEPEVSHLNLRDKAEQFTRGPLGPNDGREAEPPGNYPFSNAGYFQGEQSGPPAVTGKDQRDRSIPIDVTNPMTAREGESRR